MYYESIIHKERPVSGAREAAQLIKGGGIHAFEALTYKQGGKHVYLVNDSHIDERAFGEIAMLLKVGDDTFMQFESLTAGWIEAEERLSEALEELTETESAKGFKASLILDQPKGHEIAWFTFGCCGTGFTGNVAKQLTYGQDNGYGYCRSCEGSFY